MKITDLLNNVFDTDKMQIRKYNNSYLRILIILLILFIILTFIIKKNNYFENYLIVDNDNIVIMIEKSKINFIGKEGNIIINDIMNYYNIIKIKDDDNVCLAYISLQTNIENINHQKYQILLGKETIIDYIIRIIVG